MQHHTLETIYTLLSASNSPKQNLGVEIKKLLPFIAQLDPQNYLEHYQELIILIQQIEQATQLKQLAQKTVIGVGGGFSAGKSRFINSLLGIEALPEALEPCTAVATYLSASHQEQTHALNLLNHHISLKSEQLGQLRHFVGGNSTQNDIQLGELIQYVHLGIPQFTWEHIAFLDTPGYSKADAEHHHHSDEQLAINQLSKADYILWLVNAKNGTIRDEDLQFLQKIQPKQPIFVVLTQSDLMNRGDIEPILQSVRQNLKNRNIAIAGLMAWAAPIMKLQGQRLAGDDIHGWLDKINQPIQHDTTKDLDALIQHVFAKGMNHVVQLQQDIETLTKVKNKQNPQDQIQVSNIIRHKELDKDIILQSSRSLILKMAKIAEYLLNDMHQAAQYHAFIIIKFDKDYSDSNSLEWLYQKSCIGIESVQRKFRNLTDELGYESIQYKYALSLKDNKDAIHYMFLAAKQNYPLAYDWLFNQANQKNIDALFSLTELFKINERDKGKQVFWNKLDNLFVTKKTESQDRNKLFNLCYQHIRFNDNDQRIEDFVKYQATNQNDAEVQYNYALIFEEKNNILSTIEYMFLAARQSYQLAYDWLFDKTHQGNIDALFNLAKLFEIEKIKYQDKNKLFNFCYQYIRANNFDKRIEIFIKNQATIKNDAEIQYRYALILEEKNDILSTIEYMFLAAKQSYQLSYDWLFDKTHQGNVDALFYLTELFKISRIKSQDKHKLFNICYQYIKNINHDKRIENFIKYQAIKQNDVDAQYTYALIFEEKNNFLSTIEYMFLAAKQSYQLAYDWLFTQANQGNIDAQIRLTELFELGKTNKNDEKTIFNYCYDAIRYKSDQRFFKFVEQQAIDKQIVEAQYLLATCYAFGYVVGINYVQAYQLYENIDIENSVYNKVVIAYRYTGMQKEKTIKFIRDNKNKHNFNILNRTLLIRSFVKPELLDYNQKNAKFKILYQNILFALIFIIIITYILTIAISNATVQYNLGRYSPFTEYWYEKSAIQGNTDAMFALGQYYEKKGDSISIEKAFFWYKKLASQNNYEAMFALAKIYESKGDDTSIEQAIHWYIKLANQDNKDAFKALISIDKKKGLFKNVIFWYQKLVQDKQHNNIYENIEKYKNDSKNKILWLEKAAQTGDIFAIVTLASYYESIGDEKRALKLYKKPVSDEYKAHIIDIANSYHELNDMKNTVIWYKKSAHLGSIDSINFLINYYEKIKETKKMLFWLKVIADSGDINAIEKLATFYKTNKDYNQAIIWYIKAFELGDEYQYAINIGDSYYLKNDINEAESWYQKAADYGIDGADEKLILIEKARQKINEELEIQKRKEKEKFERTGLWKDSATNKVWMRCSLGQIWNGENCENDAQTYNWEQAKFAVDKLNEQGYAGYKDWRLPNIEELKTLMIEGKAGYNCPDGVLFQPKRDVWGNYWSGSPDANYSGYAWYVTFANGGSGYYTKYSNDHVRAVRSGQ